MFLRGADQMRYYQFKNDLANNMTKGSNNYPKLLVEALCLLNNYKGPLRMMQVRKPDGDGLASVQRAAVGQQGQGGRGAANFWHCGKLEHMKNRCPELQVKGIDEEVDNLNLSVDEGTDVHALFSTEVGCGKEGCSLTQDKTTGVHRILHPNNLYLGTCASYASIPYCNLLSNVARQTQRLVGHTNSSSITMSEAGHLSALQEVWYNQGGIANIVPLKELSKIWWIMYDS
jgi:hypothetical protein